jgi:hypothetical protein
LEKSKDMFIICESGGKYSLMRQCDYSDSAGKIIAQMANELKIRELFGRLAGVKEKTPRRTSGNCGRGKRLDIAALNAIGIE